jgi:CheY-like chemotaxis protein
MKILLLDDDAFLRDMYATKFGEHGHEIDASDNAISALTKLEQGNTYDLVLLDMIMPGMSGVEFITTAKERFPNLKLKYIVLSNQGQDEDIKGANDAGAIGYIIKAESVPSDVVKKVEELMKT